MPSKHVFCPWAVAPPLMARLPKQLSLNQSLSSYIAFFHTGLFGAPPLPQTLPLSSFWVGRRCAHKPGPIFAECLLFFPVVFPLHRKYCSPPRIRASQFLKSEVCLFKYWSKMYGWCSKRVKYALRSIAKCCVKPQLSRFMVRLTGLFPSEHFNIFHQLLWWFHKIMSLPCLAGTLVGEVIPPLLSIWDHVRLFLQEPLHLTCFTWERVKVIAYHICGNC